MLIIAGHLLVAPDQRDTFVAQHLDLLQRGRQAPGCHDLAISADAVDPGRVNNYECWESDTDLAAWREVARPPALNIPFLGGDMLTYHIARTAAVFD